ncbi:MAG: ATP-grasp domain-containing protein [Patescibacteria group bacterium]|nr:ATP-grasp domain-containing protein [Patescibacteria group bacterium]
MLTLNRRIVYVTRDIERALGTNPNKNFIIVTGRSDYAENIRRQFPDFVHIVDIDDVNTAKLLAHEKTRAIIDEADTDIIVFKNNAQIEAIAKENGWNLLNPPSTLSEKIENKISQIEWLDGLADKYMPEHTIAKANQLVWQGQPLVVQWAHGHTGDATFIVNSASELMALTSTFPERPAKASRYVNGPSFTANIIANKESVSKGNVSYQITGLQPFTDNQFSTVGNDWSVTHTILSERDTEELETIIDDVGSRIAKSGWRGLFGLDFMKDEERDRIVLVEVNARQPASTTFESVLQMSLRRQVPNMTNRLTTFEAHIMSLLGQDVDEIVNINDGAQIIQRITKATNNIPEDTIGSLELAGYKVISYDNTEPNSDLLRIQSDHGIMESHNKLNVRGREIADTIKS